eukprot:5435699-Pleurochrysis_carterae.AAC.3
MTSFSPRRYLDAGILEVLKPPAYLLYMIVPKSLFPKVDLPQGMNLAHTSNRIGRECETTVAAANELPASMLAWQ